MRFPAIALLLVSFACRAEETLPDGALLRLGKPFMKRVGTRSAFAMAPEAGRAIEANTQDVAVWDVRTGKDVRRFRLEHDALAVAISADGTQAAAAQEDGGIVVWNVDGDRKGRTLDGSGKEYWCLAFSPSGARLAAGYVWGSVMEWDVASGKPGLEFKGIRDTVTALAWSPDGKRLCAGGSDRRARLWNAETGARISSLRGHKDEVRAAAFSPDGTDLVTGSDDQSLHFWNGETGEAREIVVTESWVRSVAWGPGGKSLAWVDSGGAIHLRDGTSEDRRVGITARGFGNRVARVVTFGSDGTLYAAGEDGRLDRWHLNDDGSLSGDAAHAGPVMHVAVAANGAVATASEDGAVNLWKPEDSVAIPVGAADRTVARLLFSPDASKLAVVANPMGGLPDQQGVTLWNTGDGSAVDFRAENVFGFAWSPDGRAVALSMGDGRLVVRNLESGAETLLDEGGDPDDMMWGGRSLPDFPGGLAFGADGRRVYRAARDGSGDIDEFDLDRGRRAACIRTGGSMSSLEMSRDGRLLVARSSTGDRLIDASSGMAFDRPPAPIALAPGRPLFAEIAGGTMRILRIGKDSAAVATIELRSIPRSVAWSPDGRRLVTGLDDGSALVWDAAKFLRDPGAHARAEEPLDTLLDRAGLPNPDNAWDAAARASRLPGCVEALAARLGALTKADPSSVAPLVRQLGDDDPAKRNKAEAELRDLGPRAARDLEAARAEATDPEARTRLESILADWERGPARGPTLAWLRGVMILEWLAAGESAAKAKALLGRLQREAPWARVRSAAGETLDRIRAR